MVSLIVANHLFVLEVNNFKILKCVFPSLMQRLQRNAKNLAKRFIIGGIVDIDINH
jgi:hypothetical protein